MRNDILQRRLVSLARMFQGVDTCAAVYFDDHLGKLYIATNQDDNRIHLATTSVLNYLSDIANLSASFGGNLSDLEQFRQEIKAKETELKDSLTNISQKSRESGGLFPFYDQEDSKYRQDVDRSIAKVTSSIIASYLIPENDRAFPIKLAEALKIRGDKIQHIFTNDGTHAEMKIIDRLLSNFVSRGQLTSKKEFFLGISKRCCLNCEAARKAVNKVLKDKNQLATDSMQVADRMKSADLSTHGKGHRGLFPAAIPPFLDQLKKNEEFHQRIRSQFIKEVNKLREEEKLSSIGSLEQAFYNRITIAQKMDQEHSRSASPASNASDKLSSIELEHDQKPSSTTEFIGKASSEISSIPRLIETVVGIKPSAVAIEGNSNQELVTDGEIKAMLPPIKSGNDDRESLESEITAKKVINRTFIPDLSSSLAKLSTKSQTIAHRPTESYDEHLFRSINSWERNINIRAALTTTQPEIIANTFGPGDPIGRINTNLRNSRGLLGREDRRK